MVPSVLFWLQKALKFHLMTWNREVFGQLEVRKARALEKVAFWDAKERSCILSMEEVEAQEKQGRSIRSGFCWKKFLETKISGGLVKGGG